MSYGLLLLRVVVGGTMFSHGAQKLFGWFGGPGLRGTAGFFGSLGWRSPLAALGITVVLLNAIFVVHLKNGFFNGDGGIEFPLALASVAVALAATGPGRFSIDRLLGWDDNISGLWWGVGVAGVALAISAVTVTVVRHRERLREMPAA